MNIQQNAEYPSSMNSQAAGFIRQKATNSVEQLTHPDYLHQSHKVSYEICNTVKFI